MQFQVPQFIDIEDKVIGPFTIKQFMYLLIAGVIVFIFYKMLNLFATIILAIPVFTVALCLAFIRVHNQPFIDVIKNFLGFLRKPDFYVWKKPIGKEKAPEIIKKEPAKTRTKPVAKENLQDINWKVEID